MRPIANHENVYESLPTAMSVTQKNILKDQWKKGFVVQQITTQCSTSICGKKNLEV